MKNTNFLYAITNGAKDCALLIIMFLLILVMTVILYFISNKLFFLYLSMLIFIEIVFTLYFFRNPEREIKYKGGDVLSPADGKILSINKQKENLYLNSDAYRIVIFMNIFNVHRNRIPIDGRVEYLEYRPGKFMAAFKKEVEDVNEQMIIGIKNKTTKLLFKQIAGIIARRVVCNLKKGDKVKAGEIFGMIRFGSSVVVYIPVKFKLKVGEGDKVYAGTTLLAQLPHF